MKKTEQVMAGVLAALVAAASAGCSSNETISYTEEPDYEAVSVSPSSSTPPVNSACEVELDEWAGLYPNIDIEAVEQYLEEQNDCTYEDEELQQLLTDLNDDGELTDTSTSYGSTFPWWLFLVTKKSTNSSVTSTPKSSTNSSSSPSKTTSGFGTGTTVSGS